VDARAQDQQLGFRAGWLGVKDWGVGAGAKGVFGVCGGACWVCVGGRLEGVVAGGWRALLHARGHEVEMVDGVSDKDRVTAGGQQST
jgi:hypothetical protein